MITALFRRIDDLFGPHELSKGIGWALTLETLFFGLIGLAWWLA